MRVSTDALGAVRLDLHRLARAYGIQPTYRDLTGTLRTASAESLLGGLRALGCPIEDPESAAAHLRRRRVDHRSEPLPSVIVAWHGDAVTSSCRSPWRSPPPASRSISCSRRASTARSIHRREAAGGTWTERPWWIGSCRCPRISPWAITTSSRVSTDEAHAPCSSSRRAPPSPAAPRTSAGAGVCSPPLRVP